MSLIDHKSTTAVDRRSEDSAEPERPLSRREKLAFFAICLPFLFYVVLQRQTLVDPINPWLRMLGGLAGFAAGTFWSMRMVRVPSKMPTVRRTVGLVALPSFAIFIGTHAARVAVGTVAFVGVAPQTEVIAARVVNKRSSRRWFDHHASLSFGVRTREIDVKISGELYNRLDPWRSPGGDCLLLNVQTGRFGIRRTLAPNLFDKPIGIDRYRSCNTVPAVSHSSAER